VWMHGKKLELSDKVITQLYRYHVRRTFTRHKSRAALCLRGKGFLQVFTELPLESVSSLEPYRVGLKSADRLLVKSS